FRISDIWDSMSVTHAAAEVRVDDRLRRNRDFQFFLTGSTVSMLGSRLTTIGLPLLVLALSGSPLVAGWAGFAVAAPSVLVFLPAGALVDRWNPRRAMIAFEAGRGAAIAAVVVLVWVHSRAVYLLIAVVVMEEILGVFSALSERRLISSIVGPAKTAKALASAEGRTHMVVLLGRSLGGFLFGLGQALPFLADAVSFGFSASVLMQVRAAKEPHLSQAMGRPHLRREIGDGLRWARHDPFARIAFPLAAFATLISQALIMVFLAEAHARSLAADRIGLVLAASGFGGVIGSVVATRLFHHFKYHLLQVQMWIWVVVFGLLALSGVHSFILMALALTVTGLAGALGNIALDNYMFSEVDKKMLGRATSISRLTTFTGLALGPLLGGAIAGLLGTGRSILVLSALVFLITLVAFGGRWRPQSKPSPAGSSPTP
ncbi:MAG TPA: MFS transporter, partial [Stellaceae bacterium]|nr:MFS transporter [Stellaceae bacterium]